MGLLSQCYGIARSLLMYYGSPSRIRRMAEFYARFIRPGDLAFDVGAHVGSRVAAWSRLGARVVAVEPQPAFVAILRGLYGRSPHVAVVAAALGARSGEQAMLVSDREPTVSTLSQEWAAEVRRARRSFARTSWNRSLVVRVLTIDELIARYGEPVFCKIDAEGYELEILRGLSRPLRALSFEYIPGAVDAALACAGRLCALGRYEFNWSSGESMQLQLPQWVTAEELASILATFPADDLPGDVYARLPRRS